MKTDKRKIKRTWPDEKLVAEALRYQNHKDFLAGSPNACQAARKRGKEFMAKICSHFISLIQPDYTDERLREIASIYRRRSDFSKYEGGAYMAAKKRGDAFLDLICAHMEPSQTKAYSDEEIRKIATPHTRRNDFNNANPGAYNASLLKGKEFHDSVCSHMEDSQNTPWTDDEILETAKGFDSRTAFADYSPGLYNASRKRGKAFHNMACAHMKRGGSRPEKELLARIKEFFPEARKHTITKLKIEGKPYIHWFEADIFIPHLMLGIEFDGKYHHSFKALRANPRKLKWPDEDLLDYHGIKDRAFLSRGILIFHIKEEEWEVDKEACVKRCLSFLETIRIRAA